jgi:hypothetical protein
VSGSFRGIFAVGIGASNCCSGHQHKGAQVHFVVFAFVTVLEDIFMDGQRRTSELGIITNITLS